MCAECVRKTERGRFKEEIGFAMKKKKKKKKEGHKGELSVLPAETGPEIRI